MRVLIKTLRWQKAQQQRLNATEASTPLEMASCFLNLGAFFQAILGSGDSRISRAKGDPRRDSVAISMGVLHPH